MFISFVVSFKLPVDLAKSRSASAYGYATLLTIDII